MYTLTDFNQIPFTGPAERLQNWLSPRLATKFGSKYQTLWSSLIAVLISSLQSMIQIKYHLIFYRIGIKHFQIKFQASQKAPLGLLSYYHPTAFFNLSFNNYVDQILPNFDHPPPLAPSSGQKCPSSSDRWPTVDFQLTPHPLLFTELLNDPYILITIFFPPGNSVMNTERTN